MHSPPRWNSLLAVVCLVVLAPSALQAAERSRKPFPVVERGATVGVNPHSSAFPLPRRARPVTVASRGLASWARVAGVAPTCTTGARGETGSIVNFIFPPDDAFWTLVRNSDCAACGAADTLFFSKVHLSLLFPDYPCPMPISIGLVGSRPDPPCTTFPSPSNVFMPPEYFDLAPEPGRVTLTPPNPQPGDTVEFVFTLSQPAKVPGEAFLVLTFIDTVAGCGDTLSRPRSVMSDEDCRSCVSYNDWIGDINPDDMCFPEPIGNPLIFAEVDSCPIRDFVVPGPVADLGHDSVSFGAVRLDWTASGDDGITGQASAYDIRHSLVPIDDLNFASADTVSGEPRPATSGTPERFIVTGLAENTRHYFALRVLDEAGNTSVASNLDSATTLLGIPGAVGDLESVATTDSSVRLRWTASGDDGNLGRPLRYLIAVSTSAITPATFDAALRDSVVASVDAGSRETYDVHRLLSGRDYWFALKARDEIGNLSGASNVITVRTDVSGPLKDKVGPAIASRLQPARLPVDLYWIGLGAGSPRQTIRIYDLSGRLVRTLPLKDDANGIEPWDGKDKDGKSVPAGIYVARLKSGSREAGTRVVLLR